MVSRGSRSFVTSFLSSLASHRESLDCGPSSHSVSPFTQKTRGTRAAIFGWCFVTAIDDAKRAVASFFLLRRDGVIEQGQHKHDETPITAHSLAPSGLQHSASR
jgi:predicted 2-oxoglutarate/Fe(II)-dependent dioxygenase YbiX